MTGGDFLYSAFVDTLQALGVSGSLETVVSGRCRRTNRDGSVRGKA